MHNVNGTLKKRWVYKFLYENIFFFFLAIKTLAGQSRNVYFSSQQNKLAKLRFSSERVKKFHFLQSHSSISPWDVFVPLPFSKITSS